MINNDPDIGRIRQLCQLPVSTFAPFLRNSYFWQHIPVLWTQVARKYQVDREAGLVSWEFDLWAAYLINHMPSDEARSVLLNMGAWIEKARKDFSVRARPFLNLKMANYTQHSKHFSRRQTEKRETVKKSLSANASQFFSYIRPNHLLEVFWDGLGNIVERDMSQAGLSYELPFDDDDVETWWRVWNDLFSTHSLQFCVDCMVPIGVDSGKETTTILFDFDLSTPFVHGYPVKQVDIYKIKWVAIENLEGLGQK